MDFDSKCQSCGYSMSFDPITQSLKCPQCGNVKSIKSQEITGKKEYNSQSEVKCNKNASLRLECENCGAKRED